MSDPAMPSLPACGRPTRYRIVPESSGGYTVLVVHRCSTVPPCVTCHIWGPFEDLDLAVNAQRLAWPSATPGTEADFPIVDR